MVSASIKYRNLGGRRSVGSTPYDDEAAPTRKRAEFLTLYEPAVSVGGGQAAVAFRRTYQPKQEELMPEAEALAPSTPARNGHHINTGDTGLSVSIETVTPEMAHTWLERGGANRKPSERRVLQLIAAIQMGEWQMTGEPIMLRADGSVGNGQHRLLAIYRSGIAVQALVVRNISEAAFDVIDTGKSRNAADVLAIHGHTNGVAKAAAARGLILVERYGRFEVGGVKLGSAQAPSPAACLAYIEAHPEVAQAVHEADRLRIQGGFMGGTGLWAIALTMFWRLNPEQTQVFVDALIQGANLEAGSPILKLRNMYKGSAREWSANQKNRERLLATVIKGWNFGRRDETIQMLAWHDSGRAAERFPVAE